MTSKQHKKEMLEYIENKLSNSGETVEPHSDSAFGPEADYLLVGSTGVVLLANHEYRNDSFKTLYLNARSRAPRIAAVFLKDGKTFFRSAAEDNYFKQKHELSLKHYSNEEIQRMIMFRPEEIFMASRRDGWIQYYQPDPEAPHSPLIEELVSFKFRPVRASYSHIDSCDKYKPQDRHFKRLRIWSEKNDIVADSLVLMGASLVGISRDELAELSAR